MTILLFLKNVKELGLSKSAISLGAVAGRLYTLIIRKKMWLFLVKAQTDGLNDTSLTAEKDYIMNINK